MAKHFCKVAFRAWLTEIQQSDWPATMVYKATDQVCDITSQELVVG